MPNRFELKQLREAAEKYTYHDAGTHAVWRFSFCSLRHIRLASGTARFQWTRMRIRRRLPRLSVPMTLRVRMRTYPTPPDIGAVSVPAFRRGQCRSLVFGER